MAPPKTRIKARAFLPALLATFALVLGAGCSINTAKRHYVLAEKFWSEGNYRAAVSEFEKAAAGDPKGKLGLQSLYRAAATQTLFLGEHEKSIKSFRRFVSQTSDASASWDAQKQIGEILYLKLEQHDRAIQHYRGLLKQRPEAPERPEFLFTIGKCQFFVGQFEDAIATYREVLTQFSGSPWAERAAFEIGVAYFTRGEQSVTGAGAGAATYQEAISAFQRFLRLFPKSDLGPQARFGVANCLEELGQLDAAYQTYEELKNSYPSPKVIQIKLTRIRERKAQRSR